MLIFLQPITRELLFSYILPFLWPLPNIFPSSQWSKMAGTIPPTPIQVTAVHPVYCADKTAIDAIESPFRLGPFDLQGYGSVPLDILNVYKKPESSLERRLHSNRTPTPGSITALGLLPPHDWLLQAQLTEWG